MSNRVRVWLALCTLFACNTSSSATEREQGMREIREHNRINRWKDENRRRGIAIQQENARLDALLNTRFKGQVRGVGCDVCPELCQHIDLRPMPPDVFKAYIRDLMEAIEHEREPNSSLASRDWTRLMCMVRISGAPLHTAHRTLMESVESPDVRLEVAFHGIIYEVNTARGYQVLHELARGGEAPAAITARGYLEDFKLGLWLRDDLDLEID